MPNNLNINVKQDKLGQSTLIMDLEPYVHAYQNSEKNPAAYKKAQQTLRSRTEQAAMSNYWDKILTNKKKSLSPSEAATLEKSPAIDIMESNFAEIVYNSIDETLQANHQDKNHPAIMELTVDIDNETDPNLISVYVLDNGRGFPDKFLEQVETSPKTRETYMLKSQREKDLEKHDKHLDVTKRYDGPKLVGGHGLGVKHFLADAQNDTLEGLGHNKTIEPAYLKTPESSLHFSNLDDTQGNRQGALITLTTPLEPRKKLADITQDIKARVQAYKRKQTTPSPTLSDTSDATSQESSNSSGLSVDVGFLNHEDDPSYYQGHSPDPAKQKQKPPELDISFLDTDQDNTDEEKDTPEDDGSFSPR